MRKSSSGKINHVMDWLVKLFAHDVKTGFTFAKISGMCNGCYRLLAVTVDVLVVRLLM